MISIRVHFVLGRKVFYCFIPLPLRLLSYCLGVIDSLRWIMARRKAAGGPLPRILLADDYKPVRKLLRRVLEAHPSWEVCGEAEDGIEACEKFPTFVPDITVMDFQMLEMNGLEASRKIICDYPEASILMLSVHMSPQLMTEAVKVGVKGTCPKSEIRCLTAAIEAILQGETYYCLYRAALARNSH